MGLPVIYALLTLQIVLVTIVSTHSTTA